MAANPAFAAASAAQKKVIENDLRDFRLAGAELPDAQKARFAELSSRLAELSNQFSQHVMDATDGFSLYIEDVAELAGIPKDTLAMYAAMAEADGQPGKYKLGLQFPLLFPVLQYADNRALREKLYEANAKRASEFGPAEQDNGPLIREKLKLAAEEAQLLASPTTPSCRCTPRWRKARSR
ncbi:Oligopeptidase A [Chromobacterium violaceum]|uniref:Oligopeptidase A n=1 Tax=Chromobacterium violaceum TaxID=536 RepID=A0A447T7E5_CHRVL|nr:Oligopeptidase A [Chromobacterium violaceum]